MTKLIDAKDLNGPAERIHHVAVLLRMAADMVEAAKEGVPIVEATQPDICDAMSELCGDLSDVSEELYSFSDMLKRMVDKHYGRTRSVQTK